MKEPIKTKRRVPASALCFDAAIAIDLETAQDSATTPAAGETTPPPPVPIVIRARTSGIAHQGYWGPCVHDMAGYIAPTRPIPINYRHDRETLIGVAEAPPQLIDGELVAPAQLVPFTADDDAAEVIYKGSQGIPYQASIQLDLATLVVEEVEPNIPVEVNGQQFIGPLVVFRRWGLEAISICPFGADSHTSVEFSRGDEFDVACFSAAQSQSGTTMADTTTTPTAETKSEPTAFEAWAATTFSMDVATLNDEQKAKFMAAFEASTKPPADCTADTPENFAAVAKRMLSDFGAQGAVWAAEGKTYREANDLFRASQTEKLTAALARVAELEAKVTDFEKKSAVHRGHPTPAKFQPPAETTAKPAMADFSGHTESRQKLIRSIRFASHTTTNNN